MTLGFKGLTTLRAFWSAVLGLYTGCLESNKRDPVVKRLCHILNSHAVTTCGRVLCKDRWLPATLVT